jgi:hypothetical protein
MQITRNAGETAAGPSDWFTGTVYIDTVAVPAVPARVAAASWGEQVSDDEYNGTPAR